MFLSIVLILFFTILGGLLFEKIGEYIGGCLGVLFCFVNWFITPKYFAKSVLEICFDNTGLEITCVKPFFGSKISKIVSIKYDELKSYKFEATSNFSTFKITLKDGDKYKIHRWYNDDDQFDKFYKLFVKYIKTYNNNIHTFKKIERKKSVFENRFFLIVLAIILIVLILTAIILLFTRGVQNKSGIIFVFIFLAPLIWIFFQVINGLKK